MHPGADAYYNSAEVAHDTRWDLHLPSRLRTLEYTDRVAELILEAVAAGLEETKWNDETKAIVLGCLGLAGSGSSLRRSCAMYTRR